MKVCVKRRQPDAALIGTKHLLEPSGTKNLTVDISSTVDSVVFRVDHYLTVDRILGSYLLDTATSYPNVTRHGGTYFQTTVEHTALAGIKHLFN